MRDLEFLTDHVTFKLRYIQVTENHLEYILEKIIGIQKHAGKVRKYLRPTIRMCFLSPLKKQLTSLIFVIDKQNSPYITEAQQQMIRLICKKVCRLYFIQFCIKSLYENNVDNEGTKVLFTHHCRRQNFRPNLRFMQITVQRWDENNLSN